MVLATDTEMTYRQRIAALRQAKLRDTAEKQQIIGYMNHDDWGDILPPPELREVVQAVSGSGQTVTDVRIKDVPIKSNHPSGGFFGPKVVGENYRAFLEALPPYLDPICSLAGASRTSFTSYRKVGWNPDLGYDHLKPEQAKYGLATGIGATQHFCQDVTIGLKLGWGGLLEKVRHYRQVNAPRAADFYDGLEAIILGTQDWIRRNAEEARRQAESEENPQFRQNYLELAEMNEWLVSEPPRTLREALQWILWQRIVARSYNGGGNLGRLDVILTPYYERDVAAGILDDEEAIFHIACYLLRQTSYIQVGGPDRCGQDQTNRLSYLILEADRRLNIPSNIGVAVGEDIDPNLLRVAVDIQFENKSGSPKFVGINNTNRDFTKNGYPLDLARQRIYCGCHWFAIPGREYTLNDCVKINFAAVWQAAWHEMWSDPAFEPSVADLWGRFEAHLRRAVEVIAEGLDWHYEHMHEVFPELPIDLCCYGPIEKGLDASHGGVEFYNMCVDGTALATVADSFAALEQRVEREGRLTWEQVRQWLADDWSGTDGERARLMMRNIPRFGSGGSRADDYAVRIVETFTRLVKEKPTPGGLNMIPGLFSWANTIPMGKIVGATPNGRHAGAPISHGANPDPGFRKDGAPTALAVAIANVQPGWGNSAPMQIELDPGLTKDQGGLEQVENLIKTHIGLGGTQINMNVLDAAKLLEAHKDPSRYPDLIVRVTGFSAYFASLSPEFRQLVVDRILA